MPPEFLSPIRNGRPGWLFQTQWTFPGGGKSLSDDFDGSELENPNAHDANACDAA